MKRLLVILAISLTLTGCGTFCKKGDAASTLPETVELPNGDKVTKLEFSVDQKAMVKCPELQSFEALSITNPVPSQTLDLLTQWAIAYRECQGRQSTLVDAILKYQNSK